MRRAAFLVLVAALALPAASGRAQDPKIVEITAKRFEFAPATITLKKGETVRLRVHSEDVTHGLFLRALKIDTDITPGQTQELSVTPAETGTFTAICHHFCGSGHGNMKLTVVVE
jgi:cytochrome c oxidase subunit 2